jgi:hypothetical protein
MTTDQIRALEDLLSHVTTRLAALASEGGDIVDIYLLLESHLVAPFVNQVPPHSLKVPAFPLLVEEVSSSPRAGRVRYLIEEIRYQAAEFDQLYPSDLVELEPLLVSSEKAIEGLADLDPSPLDKQDYQRLEEFLVLSASSGRIYRRDPETMAALQARLQEYLTSERAEVRNQAALTKCRLTGEGPPAIRALVRNELAERVSELVEQQVDIAGQIRDLRQRMETLV